MSRELDIADLYRRYGDVVLGRCRSLLRNEMDAQEAMQTVFLAVHRSRESFRGEASPTTWLFKATTSTCLNVMRTRRRRPEDPTDEIVVASNDSLLDAVEARELLDILLDDEDERTQQAVLYHFLDGMTHDEVGELLGITGAAVRKRLAGFRERARQRLPERLREAV